jgi:GDP-L-fucose synthase
MVYTLRGKRVWVAGHRGMVGSALIRRLRQENPADILTVARQQLDLINQSATTDWIEQHKPDAVFIPAARVGGILANDTFPADFLYDNLMIAANIIHACHKVGVEKLLFLGSSCIYPKFADQPIVEDALLTGRLEPTNEWYAVAKIAGIKLCQAYRKQHGDDYISAMPTNLYGPGDNYHTQNSHVIPSLIRKAHEAKQSGATSMEIWGSGKPRREFLHVDDCADALVHIMKVYSSTEHINIGSGEDITIEDLSQLIMDVVGFKGELTKDTSKPDGTPRKLMCSTRLYELGWRPKISLRDGINDTYNVFLQEFSV